MEQIIINKINVLTDRYNALKDDLYKYRCLNDKDAKELSEVSYQLKVLKEVLEESKESI